MKIAVALAKERYVYARWLTKFQCCSYTRLFEGSLDHCAIEEGLRLMHSESDMNKHARLRSNDPTFHREITKYLIFLLLLDIYSYDIFSFVFQP